MKPTARHHNSMAEVYDFLPDPDDTQLLEASPAEVSAIHTVPAFTAALVSVTHPSPGPDDAGADEVPVAWFEDEEPDVGCAPRDDVEDDETADVDDVLIVQHYAFDEELADEAYDDQAPWITATESELDD